MCGRKSTYVAPGRLATGRRGPRGGREGGCESVEGPLCTSLNTSTREGSRRGGQRRRFLLLLFRFRVYVNGIRRPTQAFFSLKNSSAYVECRHCLAYRWGSLPEDAEEDDDEERVWYKRMVSAGHMHKSSTMNHPPNHGARQLLVNSGTGSILMPEPSLL